MKFAHLRVILNPFETLRGISIFNYPAMDSFFTQYWRHIVLLQKVTACSMNCTRDLVWLWRRGPLLFLTATGWWTFSSTYSKSERQLHHLKKKLRVRLWHSLHSRYDVSSWQQLSCFVELEVVHGTTALKCGSLWVQPMPCCLWVSLHSQLLQRAFCAEPWSWSYGSFSPPRGWLKMRETVFSSSTLYKEFLKQGKGSGVFAGDYFWIINYL